ncbi:SDR family oxidoreductase [Streptoalloteichus tenebrarius]|uniref:SDR family oxidoreductase n=1 Tax=Streptoalloteichus tenebrarius (strain ATCC 17920 / DSM 40477 / JCM 4838 / CBS 697.72 / NBRC 16177 / NCIMB 11028 / NRRL B-12390 / A12253. 1 / ISP 5477) TaxID=1933 RepID=UPI0020A33AB0|nr:SDR family oxidoreductase [Streptoalloteichus tenebrarius]
MAASDRRGRDNPGTVLVSGGSSGLGAAVVRAVREAGGRPLVLDLNQPDSLRDEDFARVDVADTRATERAVRELAERAGGLDAVVTAAGIDRCGRLADVPGKEWDNVVAVDLLGTAAVVRAALPYLTSSHGHVVTVASTLGLRAVSDATAYCAAKFGVVGFTRALAAELAGEVGVTLLVPGGMRTNFFADRDEKYRPADESVLNAPENVARAVLLALTQPPGCEVRELVVCPTSETSWP